MKATSGLLVVATAQAEGARERYFRAFETGAMGESTCVSRIERLSDQVAKLQQRQHDLRAEQAQLSRRSLAHSNVNLTGALLHGALVHMKALANAVIASLEMTDENEIRVLVRDLTVLDLAAVPAGPGNKARVALDDSVLAMTEEAA